MLEVIAVVVISFDILPVSSDSSGNFGLCLAFLYYYVFCDFNQRAGGKGINFGLLKSC